ncbi:cytochrome P450 [Fusarium solani]|uniref:Cytochrome P450 n=1 Tax=Fusarium solani TaxID=169388 RepID=A0A9P9GFA0_FUSSL|nr:cytochrome P450 [Fusarium solani]KAH7238021.1 cytochrome P450 [Fusarium solani]
MSPIYQAIMRVAQEASLNTASAAILSIHRLFLHPLRRVPGHFLAKMTTLGFVPSTFKFDRVYKYGPIVRVGPNVSLSDWKMCRRIYTDKQTLKDPQFYLPLSFLGHGNVFSVTILDDAQVYSQREISAHASTIWERTDMLIDCLLKSALDSPTHTADAYDLFGAWGIEIICKLLVNTDIPDDPSQTIRFLEALESSPPTFFASILVPWLQTFRFRTRIPGLLGHAYRVFAEWEALAIGLLDFQNQDRGPDDRGKFGVAPLLEAKNKQLGSNYTFREAMEEAMGTVLAGSGVSGVSGHTFIYLTYALARPQGRHSQQRLREELKGTGDSLAELTALPYLSAVIKETYRLFPAIMSTLPRILGQPVEVVDTDITLPPGTVVGMQNYVHHRDPILFPKPDELIPERWLEHHEMSRVNCMGQTLAKTELYLAVPRLVRRLDFSLSRKMKDDDMHMKDAWAV